MYVVEGLSLALAFLAFLAAATVESRFPSFQPRYRKTRPVVPLVRAPAE